MAVCSLALRENYAQKMRTRLFLKNRLHIFWNAPNLYLKPGSNPVSKGEARIAHGVAAGSV